MARKHAERNLIRTIALSLSFLILWTFCAILPASPALALNDPFLDRIARDTWTYLHSSVSTKNHLPWSWYSPLLTGGDYANPSEIGFYALSCIGAYDLKRSWSPDWATTETEVTAILDQLRAWQTGSQSQQPNGPNAYNHSLFYQWYWISWSPPVVGGNSGDDHLVPSIDNAWLAVSLITIRNYAEANDHPVMAQKASDILNDMDFRAFYHPDTYRFSWGAIEDPLGGMQADYYSNENRIINFVARALGHISDTEFQLSLNALKKPTMTYGGITVNSVSWDGSYFTYVGPALFLREMDTTFGWNTILQAARSQMRYAELQGYSGWGLSDCYDIGTGSYLQQGAPPVASSDPVETKPGLVSAHASALALITPLEAQALLNLQNLDSTFTCYDPAFGFFESLLAKSGPSYGACSSRFSALAQEWIFLSLLNHESEFIWNYFYRDANVVATHAEMYEPAWTLIWNDEFNGTGGADGSQWIYDLGHGYGCAGCPSNWGTGEIEEMTDSLQNVFQSDGWLHIRALHSGSDPLINWTSGRLETVRTDFQPPPDGIMAVEARIQLPAVAGVAAQGYWPAFWMLGASFRGNYLNWPGIGELDIMENVNGLNTWWGTLHCGTYPGGPCNEPVGMGSSVGDNSPSLQSTFHRYRIEFDKSVSPQELRWYVDGVLQFTALSGDVDSITWANATDHGFFILLDLAIGGGWPGNPTASTVSGGTMLVDYIRVYYLGVPKVHSILRASPNPTSAASVNFQVIFSEKVTGVDLAPPYDDFSLTTSGLTGAAITAVSGSGNTYFVTVSTGTGSGTLRLDLVDRDTIIDQEFHPLGGPGSGNGDYHSGEVYTLAETKTFVSLGSGDGWILESAEGSNVGGTLNRTASTLRLGDNMKRKQFRSVLSFNTSNLPDNAVIAGVNVQIKRQSVTGSGNPVEIFGGFLLDLMKGTFNAAALETRDFEYAGTASTLKTFGTYQQSPDSNGWYTLVLPAEAGNYINKSNTSSGLTQVRLRFALDDNNDGVANYLSLFSGNATAASRPKLIIQYYLP